MRLPLPSLLAFGLLVLPSIHLAAQGSWQTRTALPPGSGRWGAATFEIDGKGYVAGGYSGTTDLDLVQAYDPATDSWQTRSPLPTALRLAAGFAINGKGYVACGLSGSSAHQSALYMYDPATNTWTTRAPFPASARYGMACFVVNGIGYVVCGNSGGATGSYHTELYAYDPVANTWTQRASYPGMARFACSGFSIGNKGYVFGGRRDDQTFSNELYEYDPETNGWTQRPSLPATGRTYAGTVGQGGYGYVFAGSDLANAGLTDCWSYHQGTGTWAPLMHYPGTAYWGGTTFSLNGRLFHGHGRYNTTIPTEFFEFTSPYVGLPDERLLGTLGLGPNPCPSGGTLYLSLPLEVPPGRMELTLHNAQGQLALRSPLPGTGQVPVQLPALAPGAFTLHLLVDGHTLARRTLVVGGQ